MTVNCARIIHANQVSTNGVVHVIDRVISAVGNSIRDVIQSNEELRLLRVCVVAYTMITHLYTFFLTFLTFTFKSLIFLVLE